MRSFLIAAVAALVALTICVTIEDRRAALRAEAYGSWQPPEHVWGCVDLHVVCSSPLGEPLDVFETPDICGRMSRDELDRFRVAPKSRSAARAALGLDPYDANEPEFAPSSVTVRVAGHEWRRCDAQR